MPPRRIWDTDTGHIQVSEDRVYYTCSIGGASSQNIASLVHNVREFVRASDEPVAFILHVSGTARPPSGEDRRRATEAFNACAPRLAGVALVVDATGFSGALLRSALTMVFMIARKGFAARIFENITDATDWLGPLVDMEPKAILSLVRSAREQLERTRGDQATAC